LRGDGGGDHGGGRRDGKRARGVDFHPGPLLGLSNHHHRWWAPPALTPPFLAMRCCWLRARLL
jgi:hypothetical protein